jgi:hypothetical protein
MSLINDGAMTMNRIAITAAVLLFALWYPAANASGLPEHYPDAFAQWGVISHVDANAGRIVIDDMTVQLASDVRVYTVNTRHETIHGLRPGMRVAYGRGGARMPGAVAELWVLPADFRPSRAPR